MTCFVRFAFVQNLPAMIQIKDFIDRFSDLFPDHSHMQPWEITEQLTDMLNKMITKLDTTYTISEGIAVHESAVIEEGAVLKGPVIVSENCYIGAHAYLRGPVFLGNSVRIGPGCELKQSVIFDHTAIAHFNYIGNSLIGSHVNFEAGAIAANHFNERADKKIPVMYKGELIQTGIEKFGALVGDGSKIGANAVLSPGTILEKGSVVGRLELIDQLKR